ncbi:MAG: response regulator transcription factor, partial [Chitinophagaceae bacterium]
MPGLQNSQQTLLTKRELEVLALIAEGLNYKEVAEKLYVSPETVRKHLSNIYSKLQVNNKVAAINRV